MEMPNNKNNTASTPEFYELLSGLLNAIKTKPSSLPEYLKSLYRKPIPQEFKGGITEQIHSMYNEWNQMSGYNPQLFADAVIYVLIDREIISEAYNTRYKNALNSFYSTVKDNQSNDFHDEQSLIKQINYYKRMNGIIEDNNNKKLKKIKSIGINADAVDVIFTEMIESKNMDLNFDNVRTALKIHKNQHFEHDLLKSLAKLSNNTFDHDFTEVCSSIQLNKDLAVIKAFKESYSTIIKKFIREIQKLDESDERTQVAFDDLKKSPLYKLTELYKYNDTELDIEGFLTEINGYIRKRYRRMLIKLVKANLKKAIEKKLKEMYLITGCSIFEI